MNNNEDRYISVSKHDATRAEYVALAASAFPWPGNQNPQQGYCYLIHLHPMLSRANDLGFGAIRELGQPCALQPGSRDATNVWRKPD